MNEVQQKAIMTNLVVNAAMLATVSVAVIIRTLHSGGDIVLLGVAFLLAPNSYKMIFVVFGSMSQLFYDRQNVTVMLGNKC